VWKIVFTVMHQSHSANRQFVTVFAILALAATGLFLPANVQAEEASDRLKDNWIDKVEPLPVIYVIAKAPARQQTLVSESWNREQLERTPARSLDDILRGSSRFGSFRRTSSRVAHPTTQGVQLRNLGGNAASRTLVLLNGIPQNDPFGGWVYWNRYHPASLDRITLTPGSQSSRYGSGALGGTIELESESAQWTEYEITGTGDSQSTGSVQGLTHQAHGDWRITLDGGYEESGGYHPLKAEQRGPLDQRAFSESASGNLSVTHQFDSETQITGTFGAFHESRNNGTPLAENHSTAYDVSLAAQGRFMDAAHGWKVIWYFQERQFENQFSSVNAARTSEIAALHQFDVPARATGTSIEFEHELTDTLTAHWGLDGKWQYGQTRERYRNFGAGFTRERHAGGEQWFTGVFGGVAWQPDPEGRWNVFGEIRGNAWQNVNGIRHEFNLNNGSLVRHNEFDSPVNTHGDIRMGIEFEPTPDWTLTVAGYTGHRVPTLNELYRPFRVRNDIVEANPDLKKEFLYGGEVGIQWEPRPEITLGMHGYYQIVENPVVNTFLANGPGPNAVTGFIPAGGTGSQRQNLGQAEQMGLEFSARIQWHKTLETNAAYTLSNSSFTDSSPVIYSGNELPQSPGHRLRISSTWQPLDVLQLTVETRYDAAQYEDALNTRRLDDSITLGASILWAVSDQVDVLIFGENLLDEEIESGLSSSGLITVGTPLTVGSSVTVHF
jgi:outer membrane cobalamin receptor